MNYAIFRSEPNVIIFGEDESSNNKIVIKSMLNNNGIRMSLNDLEKVKEFI